MISTATTTTITTTCTRTSAWAWASAGTYPATRTSFTTIVSSSSGPAVTPVTTAAAPNQKPALSYTTTPSTRQTVRWGKSVTRTYPLVSTKEWTSEHPCKHTPPTRSLSVGRES